MKVIYNELEYLKKLKKNGFTKNKNDNINLSYFSYELALLFKDCRQNNIDKDVAISNVNDFCIKHIGKYSDEKFVIKIKTICDKIYKLDKIIFIDLQNIQLNISDVQKIMELKDENMKPLSISERKNLFVLYCIYRFNYKFSKTIGNNVEYNRLLTLKGKTANKVGDHSYNKNHRTVNKLKKYKELNLLEIPNYNKEQYKLLYISEKFNDNTDDILNITSEWFNCFDLYFEKYIQKNNKVNIIECSKCGQKVKINSNSQKKCKICS